MPSWQDLIQRQSSRKTYICEPVLGRPDGQGGIETKTLRLSDRAIHPNRTDVYYEPRLKGIPYYRQSIQEVRLGRSQISYGRLEIINADGGLDGDLADWGWDGRPVVVRQGFDELNAADYEPVFTGRLGVPSITPGVIQVPIKDHQVDLWAAILPAGEYSGTVPNLVSTCLATAGIASKDQTAWDAWAAENNFNWWFEVGGDGEEVGRVLDNILARLACWYGFDRSGRFIIGTFKAPDAGAADLTLADDIELLDFQEKRLPRCWDLTIEYLTATSPDPVYGSVNQQDPGIKELDGNADEQTRRTGLTSGTDANTILGRWWNLISPARSEIKLTAEVQPLALRLHDQVALSRLRFGIDQNYRLIAWELRLQKSLVRMDLFA